MNLNEMMAQMNQEMTQMNQEMADPNKFSDKPKYEKDKRIYRIGKDKDGNGSAKIRFLPSLNVDKNKLITFISVKKHLPQIKDGDKKRFIDVTCPKIADKNAECPICDYTWEKYNELKEVDINKAKWYPRTFASKDKYYTNILVIDDKNEPENNGKVFILEFGAQLFKLIGAAMNPSEEEQQEKGLSPFNAWDVQKGRDFRLKLISGKHTVNGFATWEESFFAVESTSVIEDVKELQELLEKSYCLDEFVDPSKFLTVDQLQEKLDYVLGKGNKSKPSKPDETTSKETQQETLETEMKKEEPKKDVSVSTESEDTSINDFFSQFD